MKKMIRIAIAYLILGLVLGLFYHEASYYTGFTGESVLRLVHGHALALGTLPFLILPILMKMFHLQQQKHFHRFLYAYNAGLIMTLGFMTVRGITQLFSLPISSFWDHMIGGLAGIGHVILTIGIYFLFRTYLSAMQTV